MRERVHADLNQPIADRHKALHAHALWKQKQHLANLDIAQGKKTPSLSPSEFVLHHVHAHTSERTLTTYERTLVTQAQTRLRRDKKFLPDLRPRSLESFVGLGKVGRGRVTTEEVQRDQERLYHVQSAFPANEFKDFSDVIESVLFAYIKDICGEQSIPIPTTVHGDIAGATDFVVRIGDSYCAFDTTSGHEYAFAHAKWIRTLSGIAHPHQTLGFLKYFHDSTLRNSTHASKEGLVRLILGVDQEHAVRLLEAYTQGKPIPQDIKNRLLFSMQEQLVAQAHVAQRQKKAKALGYIQRAQREFEAQFKRMPEKKSIQIEADSMIKTLSQLTHVEKFVTETHDGQKKRVLRQDAHYRRAVQLNAERDFGQYDEKIRTIRERIRQLDHALQMLPSGPRTLERVTAELDLTRQRHILLKQFSTELEKKLRTASG